MTDHKRMNFKKHRTATPMEWFWIIFFGFIIFGCVTNWIWR